MRRFVVIVALFLLITRQLNSRPQANQASHDSFQLFNDVSDERWQVIRQKAKSTSWYGNKDDPLEKVSDAVYWNKNNMNPNFDCPLLGVVGKETGKPAAEQKTVCNPERLVYEEKENGCLIYSFGSAGDFTFEDGIRRLHGNSCEIHVFDPADWERPGDTEKNIHFHAWGLRSTYDDSSSVVWPKGRNGGYKTFPEAVEALGHQNRPIDLMKIDCEGCEWSTVKDWIGLDIRQIMMETHGVPTPQGTPKARWYKKPMDISEYFQHFADNGYAIYSSQRGGGDLALEISFIKLHKSFWT